MTYSSHCTHHQPWGQWLKINGVKSTNGKVCFEYHIDPGNHYPRVIVKNRSSVVCSLCGKKYGDRYNIFQMCNVCEDILCFECDQLGGRSESGEYANRREEKRAELEGFVDNAWYLIKVTWNNLHILFPSIVSFVLILKLLRFMQCNIGFLNRIPDGVPILIAIITGVVFGIWGKRNRRFAKNISVGSIIIALVVLFSWDSVAKHITPKQELENSKVSKIVTETKSIINKNESKQNTSVDAIKKAINEKNPMVGNWNPLIENDEEYEPYMLQVDSNGSYTIIAEVEENNISGKWQDLKDGTFKFADEMSFISGIGKVVNKEGVRELVIANESGKISKFTVQN